MRTRILFLPVLKKQQSSLEMDNMSFGVIALQVIYRCPVLVTIPFSDHVYSVVSGMILIVWVMVKSLLI